MTYTRQSNLLFSYYFCIKPLAIDHIMLLKYADKSNILLERMATSNLEVLKI